MSTLILSLATANLNNRIRKGGLSSREVWNQRDQVTGQQLPLNDQELIAEQHSIREQNHLPSAKSKACGKQPPPERNIHVGNLVYLCSDKNKNKSRDKYLVTRVHGNSCMIRKFTKNQLRLKEYEVPLSECYPIQVNVPTIQGPIRGLESSSESDSESETASQKTPTHIAPRHDDQGLPAPVRDLLMPPYQQQNIIPPNPDDVIHPAVECTPATPVKPTDHPPSDSTCHQTGKRTRKPPAWQSDGNWLM